jgi:hypothetical protein
MCDLCTQQQLTLYVWQCWADFAIQQILFRHTTSMQAYSLADFGFWGSGGLLWSTISLFVESLSRAQESIMCLHPNARMAVQFSCR